MSKADLCTTPIRSRRAVLAGIASAAAIPVAAAVPAAAAQSLDAELIELGARYEPMVDRYYAAHNEWRVSSRQYRSEADAKLFAIWREISSLESAINAASVNSIEGLRVKALVAFREVVPSGLGETKFSFEDGFPFQVLFTAVAELCRLKEKMAATGYELPDICIAWDRPDEDSDDEEEA
jgi:hypothetical protein